MVTNGTSMVGVDGARLRRMSTPCRKMTSSTLDRRATRARGLTACRAALQSSLAEALSVTSAQIYGHGACEKNPQASCFDMNRWTNASGYSVPPFPFQNRPTFQQVIELTKTAPR